MSVDDRALPTRYTHSKISININKFLVFIATSFVIVVLLPFFFVYEKDGLVPCLVLNRLSCRRPVLIRVRLPLGGLAHLHPAYITSLFHYKVCFALVIVLVFDTSFIYNSESLYDTIA